MEPLAAPGDLATYMQDATYDPATLTRALTQASSVIRAYTGQDLTFVAGDVAVLSPASYPGTEVFLPELPVQAVSLVEIIVRDPNTTLDSWVTVDPMFYRSNVTGRVYLTRVLTTWPAYSDTVRVTYDHGFPVVPDPIRDVCLELASRLVDNPLKDASSITGVVRVDLFSRSAKDQTLRDTEKATLGRYTLHEVG